LQLFPRSRRAICVTVTPGPLVSAKTRYLNVLLHRRRGVFDLGAISSLPV
jgi:hypothetical protein